MAENLNLGNEIRGGFNALGDAFKEAGKKRIAELVEKQGYVAYKNEEAVKAFKNNPEYKNWICDFIDGEYRFYPPKKEESKSIDIISKYKEIKQDKTHATCISIKMIDDKTDECEYELIVVDKKTHEKKVIEKQRTHLYGEFGTKILPSLYYHLCNGLPVIDYEKERIINFTSVDGNDVIMIGNLNQQELEFIKNMKSFVDDQLHLNTDNMHL